MGRDDEFRAKRVCLFIHWHDCVSSESIAAFETLERDFEKRFRRSESGISDRRLVLSPAGMVLAGLCKAALWVQSKTCRPREVEYTFRCFEESVRHLGPL